MKRTYALIYITYRGFFLLIIHVSLSICRPVWYKQLKISNFFLNTSEHLLTLIWYVSFKKDNMNWKWYEPRLSKWLLNSKQKKIIKKSSLPLNIIRVHIKKAVNIVVS